VLVFVVMKLAVMSDFHLGYAYNTERREDSFIQAEEALNKALENNVDAILIAGDIFDSRIPSQDVLGRAIGLFKKLDAKVPIIAIHGTHERRGKDFTNPVQVLEKAGLLKHLHCENTIIDVKGEKLAVHGMSGVPEDYARIVLEKWNPKPVEEAVNILMLHQAVDPFLYTGHTAPTLRLTDLPQGFDLIVDGHIHWREEKEYGKGKFVIPGSTVLTQMRKVEMEKPKGFYIFENAKLDFIQLETPRRFYYKAFSFENAKPQNVADKLQTELSSIPTGEKKPLVRIVLNGTLEKGFSTEDVQTGSLERQFQERMIARIDKTKLGSKEILERREIIERLRQMQLSVDEFGLEILKGHLKELEYNELESAETLLAKLVEGNVENIKKTLEV